MAFLFLVVHLFWTAKPFSAHHPHRFSKDAHTTVPHLLLLTYPPYLVNPTHSSVPSYSSCPSAQLHTSLLPYLSRFVSQSSFNFLSSTTFWSKSGQTRLSWLLLSRMRKRLLRQPLPHLSLPLPLAKKRENDRWPIKSASCTMTWPSMKNAMDISYAFSRSLVLLTSHVHSGLQYSQGQIYL